MIRRFALADLDRILEIERHAFPKSPYDTATFLNLYWLYPDTFWVYSKGIRGWQKGQIVGYVVFSRDGHMISLAVDPGSRKQGIGRALIERAMKYPRIKKLRAEVRVGNKGALAFYEKMGFHVIGVVPNYYGDEDAFIIEKLLEKQNHNPGRPQAIRQG